MIEMEQKRKIRKIVQIGTSSAVVLPPEFLFAAGLKRGDRIILTYDTKAVQIEPLPLSEEPRRTKP